MIVTRRQWYGLTLFLIAGFFAAVMLFGMVLRKNELVNTKLKRLRVEQQTTTEQVEALKAEVEADE